ncbi:MAG: MotA/TolQ/ExbB proton channel family protein [Planctomycetes bacterium]|nr:MotA/TolQ/ExbB proton channel family protein [Planctomycetota bacterium]
MTDGPGQGGWLPSDVTGGAGLATLQARDSLVTWFEKGGVWMWALLALAITAALLIIERSIVLAIRSFGLRKHIGNVLAQVERGQIEEARAYCERTGGAAGAVLSAALAHQDKDRSVMEDAVQESLLHHTPKYLARLSFISLCAAVAPLLGLLGTVTGMISTFKMVTLFGTSDPRFMAGGISEALITTEAGLRVAIPALLLRGILGALADRSIGRLEAGAMSVILALLRRRERAAATRDAKTTPGQASPNTPFYADGDWGPSRGPQLAISDDPEAAGAPS